MNAPLLNIITTVVSTITTAVLIGGFITLSDMHTDVQVTKTLMEEHKAVHVMETASDNRTKDRLTAVERAVSVQANTITLYHGVVVNDGN